LDEPALIADWPRLPSSLIGCACPHHVALPSHDDVLRSPAPIVRANCPSTICRMNKVDDQGAQMLAGCLAQLNQSLAFLDLG
jgi:hypothetical protein